MEKYRIVKILNNNVVSAKVGLHEVIVVGLGIGFQAKPKDIIDLRKIEKVFELKREDYFRFSALAQEVDSEIFNTLFRIIEEIDLFQDLKLDDHSYFTMIDHLNFSMLRLKENKVVKNMMVNELQVLYPEEFSHAQKILMKVNDEFNIELPNDEVGFLAMHIINGSEPKIKNQANLISELVLECLNQIRDYYLISLKPEDLVTHRIMIHLKLLIHRVISGTQVDNKKVVLYNVLEEFSEATELAKQIQTTIESRLKSKINQQELVYLVIHLGRLEMNLDRN